MRTASSISISPAQRFQVGVDVEFRLGPWSGAEHVAELAERGPCQPDLNGGLAVLGFGQPFAGHAEAGRQLCLGDPLAASLGSDEMP